MSRIGKKPVKIVSGVKVNCQGNILEISGKLGKLTKTLPPSLSVEIKGDQLELASQSSLPEHKALHGLFRTVISNMVKGVSEGFSRDLELRGVGYRAQSKGDTLSLSLGFSHPVEFKLPPTIQAKVDANTKITVSGPDKELVGLTAAKIRKIRPPEPYKGKGVRYFGEEVKLKAGKAAASGGAK